VERVLFVQEIVVVHKFLQQAVLLQAVVHPQEAHVVELLVVALVLQDVNGVQHEVG
jgi:hypothetical protein